MENKNFEHLIEFEIPILFIITKYPYDPDKKCKNARYKKLKEMERNKIINAIKDLIKYIFTKKKKEGYEQFLQNFLKFFIL